MFGKKTYGLKSIKQIKKSGKHLDDYPPAVKKVKAGKVKKVPVAKDYDFVGDFNKLNFGKYKFGI